MSKNIQLLALLFLCCLMLQCNSYTNNKNPRRASRFYFGLSIPNELSPIVYEENWSFTGEGRIYVEYGFDSVAFNQFIIVNDFADYEPLPINKPIRFAVPHEISNYMFPDTYYEKYCDSSIYRYISNSGLYKNNDLVQGCHSVVVLDMEARKLYLYYYHD